FVGVFPVTKAHKTPQQEAMYTTLLMSTGLLRNHLLVVRLVAPHHRPGAVYSILVAGVIGSAVVPTLIATPSSCRIIFCRSRQGTTRRWRSPNSRKSPPAG